MFRGICTGRSNEGKAVSLWWNGHSPFINKTPTLFSLVLSLACLTRKGHWRMCVSLCVQTWMWLNCTVFCWHSNWRRLSDQWLIMACIDADDQHWTALPLAHNGRAEKELRQLMSPTAAAIIIPEQFHFNGSPIFTYIAWIIVNCHPFGHFFLLQQQGRLEGLSMVSMDTAPPAYVPAGWSGFSLTSSQRGNVWRSEESLCRVKWIRISSADLFALSHHRWSVCVLLLWPVQTLRYSSTHAISLVCSFFLLQQHCHTSRSPDLDCRSSASKTAAVAAASYVAWCDLPLVCASVFLFLVATTSLPWSLLAPNGVHPPGSPSISRQKATGGDDGRHLLALMIASMA